MKTRSILSQAPVFFAIPVSFSQAFANDVAHVLEPVSCLIEAQETVKLATPVSGIIEDMLVDRGDVVEAGAVVARLDSRIEAIARDLARSRSTDRSQIAALEAKVEFLTAQAERRAKLAEKNAMSQSDAREAMLEKDMAVQDLERARLAVALAEMELAQAEAVLEQKTLRSPIAGVVTERLATKGEYRDGESHVVTLARIDVLRVEAFVPISYYPVLSPGQVVEVVPEPPFNRPTPATIRVIDRVFDPATATVGIRMELPNPDLSLPAGLRCTLNFPSM